MKNLLSLIILLSIPSLCLAQDSLSVSDGTVADTIQISKHDKESQMLTNMYSELLDVEKQIRTTHNTLVDLNYMSPGVERKIQQKIDELKGRLDTASSQLDSITDKEVKTNAKPYKVTVKDCKQKLNKCAAMLKKKAKK